MNGIFRQQLPGFFYLTQLTSRNEKSRVFSQAEKGFGALFICEKYGKIPFNNLFITVNQQIT
jgi:hypothetical protein